jgi:2-polyprenyl-3-methyl-5-hydroxy-6-metoxy-1,4-benzoquinol methylase
MIACLGGRILQPELLDHASPDEARRNLQELVAINRYLGGHRILLDRLAEVVDSGEAFTFLDVGAASGDMTRAAQRRYPRLNAINLDCRALHLETSPGDRVVADAFHLPFADRSVDIVHCSLFLHHFPDGDVERLLRGMWRVARRALIVQDLERNPLAYYFIPATRWLFRWSDLVAHDGPISVEAAFKAGELAALAQAAGITGARVRRHRPAFRISLLAMPS